MEEERLLEERRAKLDDMEAALTAKHAALDVKMQAWVRRARKDSWQPPRVLSASARWATCVKDVDLQPVRQLCERVERKQAWLERRAHELADLEGRLERRLAAVEQDLVDDPEGVVEGGLSEATLQEAKELLVRRRPRKEVPRPKSRLEIAWLSTLSGDVEVAEPLAWVDCVDANEDPRHFASPLALKWAEQGRSSLACVSAALVVRVDGRSLSDAVDVVTSAGGHVTRVDASQVAAVFCGHDDDEDREAAVATLAALSCAALPGAAATVAVGPVALVDVKLALDERWLCACGEAVTLAASATSTGVRVTAATAARLVQRGWPRGVFSATDDDNMVAVAPATRPPPMKPKQWTEAVVDDAQVVARAPGLALAAAVAATSSHHLATMNGTARRYGGRRVKPVVERQATFVCAKLRCAGRDDEDLETVACATNAALRAFGGLCCDLALNVVDDDWGLELTAVFPGEDAAALACTAALAVDVALARLVPYHRVGVASGSARVAVLGTTQRRVAVSSPAKTLAATLATQRQRVVIDGDAEPTGAVPLCPLSFPASEPAATAKSDGRFRAAATLIGVGARPVWRSARAGEMTPKLASAVVNNLVTGGRKRRAVTRDVASTALHAYRLAFAGIKIPNVALGESVDVSWETWSRQKPLSAAAFAALAPALPACDVYDLDALWIRSRGVPIRVATLALAWAACGSRDAYARGAAVPSAVRDAALARLAELPPPTQQLLRAAAIGAGAGGTSTLRASVLALPALKDAFLGHADDFDDRFRAALDELQAAGWLRRTVDVYSLDHDAVAADAIYESTPAPRRRAVHAAHAAALRTSLETSGAAKDDADVLRLAHHAVLARDADSAFAAVAEIVARGGPNFMLAVATHKLQSLGVPDALPLDRIQALIPVFRDCRGVVLALRATRIATRVLAAAAAFKRVLKR